MSIWYTLIFCVIIERNTLSMCAICTTSTISVFSSVTDVVSAVNLSKMMLTNRFPNTQLAKM